jgi:hypothetical protein
MRCHSCGCPTKNRSIEPETLHELRRANPIGMREHATNLVTNALRAHRREFACVHLDRFDRCGIDREPEARGKSRGTQHAKSIFTNACVWITNRAHDAGAHIPLAIDKVHNRAGQRFTKNPIDREVATLGIRARIREANARWTSAVEVFEILAKGRHFDRVRRLSHEHHTERFTNAARLRKDLLHFFRSCTRRDVVVLRLESKERVAHAAAREIRRVTRIDERTRDVGGGLARGAPHATIDRVGGHEPSPLHRRRSARASS